MLATRLQMGADGGADVGLVALFRQQRWRARRRRDRRTAYIHMGLAPALPRWGRTGGD